MIPDIDRQSLEHGKKDSTVMMIYCIIHHQISIPDISMIQITSQAGDNCYRYVILTTNTNLFEGSFFVGTMLLWKWFLQYIDLLSFDNFMSRFCDSSVLWPICLPLSAPMSLVCVSAMFYICEVLCMYSNVAFSTVSKNKLIVVCNDEMLHKISQQH